MRFRALIFAVYWRIVARMRRGCHRLQKYDRLSQVGRMCAWCGWRVASMLLPTHGRVRHRRDKDAKRESSIASCDVIGDRRQEHSANNTMHPKTCEGW